MAMPEHPPDRFTLWNQRVRELCTTVRCVLATIAYAAYVVLVVLAATGNLPAEFDEALAAAADAARSL